MSTIGKEPLSNPLQDTEFILPTIALFEVPLFKYSFSPTPVDESTMEETIEIMESSYDTALIIDQCEVYDSPIQV